MAQLICKRTWQYLSVLDNDFSPETLENIRVALENPLAVRDHVGIVNIHKQLVLIFDEEYGLEIVSRSSEDTSVTMVMLLQDVSESKCPRHGP